MRVLQLNKYFYLRDGTSRYLFDVSDLLQHHGHSVIPFAMDNIKNDPTPYAKYFAPFRATEQVRFTFDGLSTALNMIYSFPAKKKLRELLSVARPQVAHIHNAYHQLSSSVLDALRGANVPAVMTIHDYRLLSPNYTLFHDGKICERGIGNAFEVVPHRCIKHSIAASLTLAIETAIVRARRVYEKTISRFLVPSRSSYDLFARAGWDMKKFIIIPHFLDARRYQPSFTAGMGVVYVGRLSPEKGVGIYIEAARRLPGTLFRIIGRGPDEERLRALAHGLENVEFVGWLEGDALREAIASAALVVVPSECYEVFGYSALEAMALGKPVVASRIGALPELVRDGVTGKLFSPGNADELATVISSLLASPATLERMGRAARAVVERDYTPEKHFAVLMEAYSDAMSSPRSC